VLRNLLGVSDINASYFAVRSSISVTVILVLCVTALKAALVFSIVPGFVSAGPDYKAATFPDDYDHIAENLLAGNGYRVYPETSQTLLRTPGYVMLLAGVFWIFGKSMVAVQAVNFVLSLMTAWVIILLVRRLSASSAWALLAGALCLLHPGMIMAETRGGLESLLALCLVTFVYFAYVATVEGRLRQYVFAGLSFGLCLLVKSSAALMLPAMAVVALLAARDRRQAIQRFRGYFLAGVVGVAVLSPWVLRNYAVTGEVIPTMTLGGLAAFQGLYVVKNRDSGLEHYQLLAEAKREQDVIAQELQKPYRPGFFPQFFDVQDEITFYGELGRRAREDLFESPLLAARLVTYNAWAFWFQGRTGHATFLNIILTVPLLVLVAIGIYWTIRDRMAVWLLIAAIIAFILPHIAIIAVARFYIPLIPLLSVFATYPLSLLYNRWARRNETQSR
jgi:4-amino-4-deoxy-L-arabinose transferase-like glycosyltransferase